MDIATVVTPNLPELAVLGGSAEALVAQHGCAVLAKGGHGEGIELVDQLVMSDGRSHEWRSERIETRHTHGTGCTLASAIATGLGQGRPLSEAVEKAREFVRASLLAAPGLGNGHGPMGQGLVR